MNINFFRNIYQVAQKLDEAKKITLKKIKDYIPLQELDYDPNKDIDNKAQFVGYKQFKTLYDPNKPNDPKNMSFKGKLYPLFVKGQDDSGSIDGIEVGKWYRCGQGELLGCFDENGNPIIDENGDIKIGVKSSLGKLSFRPGWHLGSAPVTRHIGVGSSKEPVLDKDGNPIFTKTGKQKFDYGAGYSQNVWALVEFSAQADVTSEQLEEHSGKDHKKEFKSKGIRDFRDNDKYKNSYYHFKTNTNADDSEDWIISDAIKVIKVLNDEEVNDIAKKHGLKAQYRWKADGTDNNKFIADFSQFYNKP